MTEGALVFCLLFTASMLAIAAFVAARWAGMDSGSKRAGIVGRTNPTPDVPAKPYSPPRMDRIPANNRSLAGHDKTCAFSLAWFGIIPPECTCGAGLDDPIKARYSQPIIRPLFIAHSPMDMPTFQDFAADSADEKIMRAQG